MMLSSPSVSKASVYHVIPSVRVGSVQEAKAPLKFVELWKMKT